MSGLTPGHPGRDDHCFAKWHVRFGKEGARLDIARGAWLASLACRGEGRQPPGVIAALPCPQEARSHMFCRTGSPIWVDALLLRQAALAVRAGVGCQAWATRSCRSDPGACWAVADLALSSSGAESSPLNPRGRYGALSPPNRTRRGEAQTINLTALEPGRLVDLGDCPRMRLELNRRWKPWPRLQ